MNFLTIEEPAPPLETAYPVWSGRHAFWALGFRPFYVLAALLAASAVPAWLARYFGWLTVLPNITLGWHMHEMVFGFAIAVVVGFLFTAGRAWTGLWTPRGLHLAALALLWIAGRAAMLTAPPPLAAAVDMLFLPLAAWSMFRVLQRAGNKRNMFLVGLLALLTAANGVFHAAALGWIPLSEIAPIHAGILLVVQIEAVIGGRVIPMFTDNAAGGPKAVVRPRGDRVALGLLAAASASWIFGVPGAVTAALALAAAAASARRLAGWKPLRSVPIPLLWILHLSYAWIPAGFVLLALAALGMGAASTAFHALAVGSMAGLIVGMMTRTTLGHTGRKLVAGKAETAMYLLIQAGAAARVAAGIAPPSWREAALMLSGSCWSLAFVLFLLVYTPYLWRRRLDGKEG
ncbi:NnrS family protein [Massilia endophytica]|uniref:NnrS family protein n=1 Tax=Massilia endophytica TaxID=2899220 RepID=UPI001E5F76AA|nr:NnrS family protein [Massilia endophytica]UGQ46415.1 NnrS family protein [Massilia endophytica]